MKIYKIHRTELSILHPIFLDPLCAGATGREVYGQTDRQTDIQRDRQIDRQIDREIYRQTDRRADGHIKDVLGLLILKN